MSQTRQEEELVRKLKELSSCPWIVEIATVKEVDEVNLSCLVELLVDETEIPNVRLKAGIDGVTDGIVQIPSIDSQVLIAMINNDVNTRVIVAFSKVDKTLINHGDNGGLINIQTLIENLNKTNEVVNAIKDSLLNWTPVPNDGGAALKTYATTQLSGKVTGDFSDMEDIKVKH
jgi:hypothetical protein